MSIASITNGEAGVSVRASLNSVIDVINGDAPASDVVGVSLTAGVTGVLPLANGGTGAVLTGSKTYDPASMLTLTQVSTTVTVTGAAVGDYVLLSHSVTLAGVSLTGYVSATDTVTAVYFNGSSGTVDVASGTLQARVIKTA